MLKTTPARTLAAERYGWYSTVSQDRGKSFEKNRIIEATRKPDPAEDPE